MSTLISAADLAAVSPVPAILDVRWRLGGPPGIEDYRAGHIPGAVFVDLNADLAAPAGKDGRHPLPGGEDFQESMRRLGVGDGKPVVVYDGATSAAAARAWWLLRYFGHTDVRVLDGGYRAWEAFIRGDAPPESPAKRARAGRAYGPAQPVPRGDFTARPGHLPLLDADGAESLAKSGLLLDARSGERYRGETEPVDPVAGHIPGAVSAPTTGNVAEDGTFLPKKKLAARFRGLGVDTASEVGAYCGSGVTAAHEVLALSLAGVTAALYIGSWSEWVTDPSRPVETGA